MWRCFDGTVKFFEEAGKSRGIKGIIGIQIRLV
jgi:hypothetical protein